MESNKTTSFSKKEAVSFGFKKAKENILFFIGIFVIWIFITGFTSAIQQSLNSNNQFLISFLFNVISWVISSILSMGLTFITLKLISDEKPVFKDLYYTKKLFNFMLASIIKGFIVVIGFLLFIIPGIIWSIKFQFMEYFIVDKKMDAVDSLKASWELTKGVKWNLFLFGFLLALINIVGFLCLLVGLVITVPLTMIATAYVYRKLLSQSNLK